MISIVKSIVKIIAFACVFVFAWVVYVLIGSLVLAWQDTMELIYKKKSEESVRTWNDVRDQAPPRPTFLPDRRRRRRGHRGGKKHRKHFHN